MFKTYRITKLLLSNEVKRYSSTLIIAEHDNTALAAITARTITAAKKIGGKITILVAGTKCEPAVNSLSKTSGVERILVAEDQAFNGFVAENLTALIISIKDQVKPTHILAGASTFGKAVLPRLASKLDVSPISDVVTIKDPNVFIRSTYAGNVLQTVKTLDPIKIMTIRGTSFAADPLDGGTAASEKVPAGKFQAALAQFVSQQLSKSDRPDLATAKIVVSGGRGLKTKENFKIVYDLASKLNAAVGASRAAVDGGMVPNDLQVGQTGKIVAPELYIAIGISGAIQHVAGMKESKTIVAINKDAEAPIFQIATYGLIADLFKAVPEMISKIK